MPTATDAWSLEVNKADLTETYDAVLFPFNAVSLLRIMPEQGWIVPELTEDGSLDEAPTKGGLRFGINTSSKQWSVRGRNMAETVAEFRALCDLLAEEFPLPPHISVRNRELRYQGIARGDSSPTVAFESFWAETAPATTNLRELLTDRLPAEAADVDPDGIRKEEENQRSLGDHAQYSGTGVHIDDTEALGAQEHSGADENDGTRNRCGGEATRHESLAEYKCGDRGDRKEFVHGGGGCR